jgi:fucose 4-O-acetylase-like acetyltransferase
MKLWQRVVVTNLAGLLGVSSSLFVLPTNTPFFLWLGSSILVLAVFNIAIFRRHQKTASGTVQSRPKAWDVLIALCVAFWILDVLVHILRR